jgi:hypothetical protein
MENKELRDMLGTPFKVGSPCVWTTHNFQWIGTIKKICKSRVRVEPLPGSTRYTRYEGLPFPEKVIQLDVMPKAALFMAIKGLDK